MAGSRRSAALSLADHSIFLDSTRAHVHALPGRWRPLNSALSAEDFATALNPSQ